MRERVRHYLRLPGDFPVLVLDRGASIETAQPGAIESGN